MSHPMLSVVIPAFNRRAILDLTLRCLLLTKADPRFYEIIVVDDGSTDGTGEHLLREFPTVIRVWRGKNIGKPNNPGLARNCGIRVAKGQWIAFTDCDVLHLHDIIGATLEAVGEPAVYQTHGTWIHEKDFDSCKRIGFQSGHDDMPCYFWWVAPREILIEIGGFDERFTDYGAEDEDIQLRLRKYGLRPGVIHGQFSVGPYASRGLPRGVISQEQNARQHELKRTDSTIIRNIGVNWGDPSPAEEGQHAL